MFQVLVVNDDLEQGCVLKEKIATLYGDKVEVVTAKNEDELLAMLDRTFNLTKDSDVDNANIKINAVAGKILEFIDNHYTENISLREVANAMGYSDAYFCKIFRQCFEMSFISYLNDYRTKKAMGMLGDVTVSIKDISTLAGYHDANYFTRIFKKNTGITPSEYRERVIRGDMNYVV